MGCHNILVFTEQFIQPVKIHQHIYTQKDENYIFKQCYTYRKLKKDDKHKISPDLEIMLTLNLV